jgi:molecular chaperone GrpE
VAKKKNKTEGIAEDITGEEEAVKENAKVVAEAEQAGAGEEEPAEEGDELEKLRQELEEVKARAAEYLDGWQRAQAEFSNYKKRQAAEHAQWTALANATLLRRLLPIADDFERAIVSLPHNLSKLTWCEGVGLIKYKLDNVLESEGVKPIATEGETFDPRYHEAVTYEEAEGHEEGQIIGEVQRGYTLGERVLRPALVRVAKAPPVIKEEPEETEDSDPSEVKE